MVNFPPSYKVRNVHITIHIQIVFLTWQNIYKDLLIIYVSSFIYQLSTNFTGFLKLTKVQSKINRFKKYNYIHTCVLFFKFGVLQSQCKKLLEEL
jgi:hypothetical protein